MSNSREDWERRPLARQRPASLPWIARRWHVREFIAFALLITVPSAVVLLDLSGVLVFEAGLFALAGMVGVVWLRGDWRLLGPQFYYDVICLARRGRSSYVRILYVSALLVGQGFVYSSFFGHHQSLGDMLFGLGPALDRNQIVALSGRFVGMVIIMQNLAVVLMTPAYAATAITEERERRTLELMFTSHLSDREIVIGKLSSRLLHMGGVLLAGLPVLSLSQFLGGVDMMVLLANFALTAMNLFTVGAVCIMVSVYSRKALTAVLVSYAVLLPLAFVFGCASRGIMLSEQSFGTGGAGDYQQLEFLGVLMLMHLVIGGTCLTIAVTSVRSMRDADVNFSRPSPFDDFERPFEAVRNSRQELAAEERIVLRRAVRALPPIEGDPLVWKEMNLGGKIIAFSPAFWVPLGSLLIPLFMMFVAAFLTHGRGLDGDGGGLGSYGFFKFLIVLLAMQFCLGVAYRSCASIAFERQQGTLDALLTLPVERRDIMKAKWLGAIAKGWGWSIFFIPILLLGMLGGGIDLLGAVGLVAAIVIHAGFLGSLGLLLSVVSPTVLAAQTRMILFILLVLVVYIVDNMLGNSGWIGVVNFLFNPLKTWEFLIATAWEIDRMPDLGYKWLAVLFNLAFFAMAGRVLWLLACRRFADSAAER